MPRDGELPVRCQIDNALNNSTGRVWVSQDDYGLARVEFEMSNSVRFWGGILGTLRNTVGRLEFTRVADQVWMPTTIDIKFDLRILFRNIRRRIVREWAEYSRLPATDQGVSRGVRFPIRGVSRMVEGWAAFTGGDARWRPRQAVPTIGRDDAEGVRIVEGGRTR